MAKRTKIRPRGRPPVADPADHIVTVRLTHSELANLDWLCKQTGRTQSDLLRQGLASLDPQYGKLHPKY